MRFVYFLIMLFVVCSCSKASNDIKRDNERPSDIENKEEFDAYIKNYNYKEVPKLYIPIGRYFLRSGQLEKGADFATFEYYTNPNISELKAITAYYLMMIYYEDKKVDSLSKYLNYTLENLDNPVFNNRRRVGAYSMAAVYNITTKLDYATALDYFDKAYQTASKLRDSIDMSRMLINISALYTLRSDTSGLHYAQEAYDIARAAKIEESEIYAALSIADNYILKEDYKEAYLITKQYIDNDRYKTLRNEIKTPVLRSYATTLKLLGMEKESEIYFDEAKENVKYANMSSSINIATLYAGSLLEDGKYGVAIEEFLKAADMSKAYHNVEYQNEIYLGLCEAYTALGDLKMASDYLLKYKRALETTSNYKAENDFRNMILKNEREKHQQELHIKELDMTIERRTNYIYALLIVILVICILCSFIIYRRRIKHYKNTAIQYEQFRQTIREQKLIDEEKRDKKLSEKFGIFEKLEELMNIDKIYMDKNLSADSLCTILATNSTDLSVVVNRYSNNSIPSYINSYRIQYVINAFSDRNNTDSITAIADQAGFASKSTFLRTFKKEVGCTPSIYREEILSLNS